MGDAREHLIRKGAYFYRPNCQGYTTSKFEAGRYTRKKAELEASVEPWHMKAIHQDEWPNDPPSDRISALEAERDALRAQVDCRDATIATQNGMIVDWATKFRDLTAERDRLTDYVRFVALWCNREDPPNGNHKLTNDERLSVIKHHPVTFSVVNAAIDAALAKLK